MSHEHLNYTVQMEPILYMPSTYTPSSVVFANMELLAKREEVGIKKYGTNLERANLPIEQLLQHLLEEQLDGANYIQAALQQLAKKQECAAEKLIEMIEKVMHRHMLKTASWTEKEAVNNVVRDIRQAILHFRTSIILKDLSR